MDQVHEEGTPDVPQRGRPAVSGMFVAMGRREGTTDQVHEEGMPDVPQRGRPAVSGTFVAMGRREGTTDQEHGGGTLTKQLPLMGSWGRETERPCDVSPRWDGEKGCPVTWFQNTSPGVIVPQG